MATFRERFRATYDRVQRIAGPGRLDVRTNKVIAIVRRWSGASVGIGSFSDERTDVEPRPRVKELQGGRTLHVGPVSHSMTPAELNPGEDANTEVLYEIEGPNAGFYRVEAITTARPFRAELVLRRLNRRQAQPQG